jgi:hypothetical protein
LAAHPSESGRIMIEGAIAVQPDMRFSDPETDEALRLPSRQVVVVLAVVSLLMLVLASLAY